MSKYTYFVFETYLYSSDIRVFNFFSSENKFKNQNDKIEIENLVNDISKVNGIAVSSDLPEHIKEIRTVRRLFP